MKRLITYCFIAIVFTLVAGCSQDDAKLSEMEEYTGPSFESENVVIKLTEATVVKVIMKGKKQLQFQNGDIEFPEGLEVTFFDENGEKTTILTAQKGFKSATDNLYRANGDVVVRNLIKEETLRTEELFWNPETKKIFTDKFVTVQTLTDIIPAEGLTAPQDFSTYQFIKPKNGEFQFEDN
ncbi:LPS export ABC transporter periplasmic protein LptC [Roseivirga misakiensis]|uniref:LPS export ABC transporter periplasmic protein LptC n=1 Tax=Roseivirga misakiensis TaxID=1563681 RepID=A0A1E5T6L2_9BACT|nr:LPS export ABC transporter periplasmic protein LptC [Roseivirga misakiensis]OEK06986.1 LPS export ABC transporter periplasmic protein LptC [Roseivirga misakiensis]